MAIADCVYSADGRLIVITDTGELIEQSRDVGHEYNHLAASKRPEFVFKSVEAPPSLPKRLMVNAVSATGHLACLCVDGHVYQQVSTRGPQGQQLLHWQKVEETP